MLPVICEVAMAAFLQVGCRIELSMYVQMHIVKNWLVDNGWLDNTIRVPLILGIWGGKGQGVPATLRC